MYFSSSDHSQENSQVYQLLYTEQTERMWDSDSEFNEVSDCKIDFDHDITDTDDTPS